MYQLFIASCRERLRVGVELRQRVPQGRVPPRGLRGLHVRPRPGAAADQQDGRQLGVHARAGAGKTV